MGSMTARLSHRFQYLATEEDLTSARIASTRLRMPSVTVMHGRAEAVAQGRKFDAVLAFEVLEHIRDDYGALRDWSHLLKPGGVLILSVPAKASRFGKWDVAVGHYRRYERLEIQGKLSNAGYTSISVLCYGWPVTYVTEWVRNQLVRNRSADEPRTETLSSGRRLQPTSHFAGALTWLISLPLRLIQWPTLKFNLGTSFVVVAKNKTRNPLFGDSTAISSVER